MKLACTSGTCSQLFDSGELTQLEFLDFCASEFACDSVVLDVRHFPRIDDDYLAQIKKMAADLGVTIAALADEAFLTGDPAMMDARVAQASALGTPLLLSRVAQETVMSWSRQLERLNHATGAAKAANITLGMRNVAGTFAGSVPEVKRVSKEADSAWLRYALDPAAFDGSSDIDAVRPNAVAFYGTLTAGDASISQFLDRFGDFRGPLVLDAPGSLDVDEMRSATRRWRVALARFELNRN